MQDLSLLFGASRSGIAAATTSIIGISHFPHVSDCFLYSDWNSLKKTVAACPRDRQMSPAFAKGASSGNCAHQIPAPAPIGILKVLMMGRFVRVSPPAMAPMAADPNMIRKPPARSTAAPALEVELRPSAAGPWASSNEQSSKATPSRRVRLRMVSSAICAREPG
ncbi:hypothetical protein AK812_SmicGene49081 [Symbiodinium microadriaticum]|uniref:Uncharacterized protein n=1 Tax=Symbiodinium microadriaticum TaxID=2951 RepID=A0A1Q9D0X6_SYMMI|nr:hypothetical protein AK812_SmicGene49081 [Symbiodinium microadriaticum]